MLGNDTDYVWAIECSQDSSEMGWSLDTSTHALKHGNLCAQPSSHNAAGGGPLIGISLLMGCTRNFDFCFFRNGRM